LALNEIIYFWNYLTKSHMERWLCDNTVLYSNQCTADE
ncbi:hypothetical protein T03_1747, partial [Trichinella britovi]